MLKTNVIDANNKIAVDIKGLQALLSAGRKSSEQIATNADAVIRIGRRKLYNVRKVQDYLDRNSRMDSIDSKNNLSD